MSGGSGHHDDRNVCDGADDRGNGRHTDGERSGRGTAGHGHTHGHGIGHAPAGARYRRPLALALALTIAFLVVQVVAGFVTGSLVLLSDAGHLATDALGLGLALAAIQAALAAASGSGRGGHTFGLYRLEILAALTNAVLLIGVTVLVLVEAVDRLRGDVAEVASIPVLVVGVLGLGVNLVAFRLLRAGASESLNVRAAATEVMADALGSLGVIVSAVVTGLTGVDEVDPLVGAALALFILPRAWRLGREALRVLVQAAPREVDLDAVRADLAAIPGVVDVHDLHVWTLTSAMDVASAHVMVRSGTDTHAVLDQARSLLSERHRLDHATVQVEPDDHKGCDEVTW